MLSDRSWTMASFTTNTSSTEEDPWNTTQFMTTPAPQSSGMNSTKPENASEAAWFLHINFTEKWPYLLLVVPILATLIANVLVLGAVCRNSKIHRTLFYLLSSLAICNMLNAAVVMPFTLSRNVADYFPFAVKWCKGWQILSTILTTSSIIHMGFSIGDCHINLLNPIKYHLRKVRTYTTLNLVLAWVFSLLLAIPFIVLLQFGEGRFLYIGSGEAQSVLGIFQDCTAMGLEQVLTKIVLAFAIPLLGVFFLSLWALRDHRKRLALAEKMQSDSQSHFSTSAGDVSGYEILENNQDNNGCRALVHLKDERSTSGLKDKENKDSADQKEITHGETTEESQSEAPSTSHQPPDASEVSEHSVNMETTPDGPKSPDNDCPNSFQTQEGIPKSPSRDIPDVVMKSCGNLSGQLGDKPGAECLPDFLTDALDKQSSIQDEEEQEPLTNVLSNGDAALVEDSDNIGDEDNMDNYKARHLEGAADSLLDPSLNDEAIVLVEKAFDDENDAGDNMESSEKTDKSPSNNNTGTEQENLDDKTEEANNTDMDNPQEQSATKSKAMLNGPYLPLTFGDDAPMDQSLGHDNQAYVDTPLADAIQVMPRPDGSSGSKTQRMSKSMSVPEEETSKYPSSRTSFQRRPIRKSSSLGNDRSKLPKQRSILRRDSRRSTVRKNVKFASTVCDSSGNHKPSGLKRRKSPHPRKMTKLGSPSVRQAIVMNTDMEPPAGIGKPPLDRCNSIQSMLSLSNYAEATGKAATSPLTDYLAWVHSEHSKRMIQRITKQQKILRMIMVAFFIFSLLCIPHHVLYLLCGACMSCDNIYHGLPLIFEWMNYSSSLAIPLIFFLMSHDFRVGLH